ncbi:MAG: PAS domain-containing protein [Roseimicrobium sp.]
MHATNASELQRLNQALQESQRRLEEAQRMARIGHWDLDLETLNIIWSEEIFRIFGLPPDRNMKLADLVPIIHEGDRERCREHYAQAIAGLRPYDIEYRIVRPNGEIRHVHSRGSIQRDETGKAVKMLGTGQDVTERVEAEMALRESEQRFRQVTESIGEVFWLTDLVKNQVIYVSPAYEKIWGRSCAELYQAPQTWMDAIHPEDRESVRETGLTMRATGGYDVIYRILRPDGAVRWIHDRAFPIRDQAGRVYRVAGVANDITTQREMEMQLRHSQKMEAVGVLAGGIAHDFNNLLAVIQLQTSLLLTTKGLPDRVTKGMRDIMEASERAAALTHQLLTFSRREVKKARRLDLAEVVESTIRLLRRVLGEDVALETHFDPGLPLIHADPGMMEQVLMNLAINARDAMPSGGLLVVSLQPAQISQERAALHPGAIVGRHVCLSVRDTGTGIAPEHLSRIFEPFFTTKESGQGTGLGLATVFGIVEQHGGWIEAASEVGRGTIFRVYLPALAADASVDGPQDEPDAVRGGTECILIVEDDEALLTVAQLTLEHHGYRVLTANTAVHALEIWKRERANVDALVTDLILPGGLSGQELADLLIRDKPSLKIIHTSGYNDDVVTRRLREATGSAFLRKPYSARQLAEMVRMRLDRMS